MSIEAASPEVAAVEVAAAVAAADEGTEALLLTARPSLMETEHLLLVPLPGAAEGAGAEVRRQPTHELRGRQSGRGP